MSILIMSGNHGWNEGFASDIADEPENDLNLHVALAVDLLWRVETSFFKTPKKTLPVKRHRE